MSDDVTVDLSKHHGLGNDFLIALDPPRELGSADAKRWCDRRTGIGADGLIVATRSPQSDDRRWTMTLWNADGGRAEISGNGIRCLGQAIGQRRARQSAVEPGTELLIDTDAGSRSLTLYPSGDDTWLVRAGMGPVSTGPATSAAWIETGLTPIHLQRVDVGNPHVVAIVDASQFDQADMAAVGPVIESGYPGGINVHVVHVADDHSLELKVWERGVGITQACGSGACAAAWAANHHGLVGRDISVSMPGGSASVELTDDEAFLIGPATFVGSIRVA